MDLAWKKEKEKEEKEAGERNAGRRKITVVFGKALKPR